MTRRLPVTDIAADNTAMSCYMNCPREYQLAMLQGWRAKKKKTALSFGAFVHRLLETHYKTGGDPNEVLTTFTKYQHEVPDDGDDYRTANRAFIDYKNYVKKYPIKLDCPQTVGFPHTPMVELQTTVISDKHDFEYAVKIDRIFVENGLGYVEDHKTTSRLDKHYFSQFERSNQMMGYVWAAKKLAPDIKIVGARINVWHVLTAKTNFDRHIVTFSDSILNEWEDNAARWLRRIERSVEEDDFPGHFGDNGCSRKFGKCDFFNVCSSSPLIRDEILKQEFHIDQWDPMTTDDETSNE